jgi:hypothetical protein
MHVLVADARSGKLRKKTGGNEREIQQDKRVKVREIEREGGREIEAGAGRVSKYKGLAKSLPCTGTGKNEICVHMMRQKRKAYKPKHGCGCGTTCDT